MDGSGSLVTHVEDPDLEDQTDAVETWLDSVPSAPIVKEVYLLSLTGEQNASGNDCKVLASWEALSNGTQHMTFPEPLAAVTDQFVVTVAPTADALEYRSLETGEMEFVVPAPQGLEPANDRWRFFRGQLQVGQYGANWVFDLQTQRRIDIPGGEAYCVQRYPEDQLSIYWKWAVRNERGRLSIFRVFDPRPLSREGEWIIMDERLGKPALVMSSGRGFPVRVDDERLALCSARYSLSAEIFHWKRGETEKWIAPRRWLAPVLCMLVLGFAGWGTLWLIQSKLSEAPLWTDALALVLPFLMLTAYWLVNFGNLEWRASKIDDLLRQGVAAIFFASLLVLFVLLIALPYRRVVKILLALLSLACAAGVLRLGLVELPPVSIPDGEGFVVLPSYDDFWSVHGFLLLSVSVVAMALFVLRRRGFHLTSGNSVQHRRRSSDSNVPSAMTDYERDLAPPSIRHRSKGTRIVDWMLLTAVMAIGLQVYGSACKDWEFMLGGLFFFWTYLEGLVESILLSALSLFAVVTAFTASKFRFAAGVAVSLCLAAWSLFHPIAEFVLARTLWGPWSEAILLHFVVTSAWLVFLFCFLLRRRGWRFTSRSGNFHRAESRHQAANVA
jgi:hypothetical protein